MKERLDLGDPVAHYTYSILSVFAFSIIRSVRFGMYSYPKDLTEAALYLELAVSGGNVLAQLSKGTAFQIGDQREVNGTLMIETILPAWRLLYANKLSLFEGLYEKRQSEVFLPFLPN